MIEAILTLILSNPEVSAAIGTLVVLAVETGIGMIPDKYVKYIGLIRLLLREIRKRKGGGTALMLAVFFVFVGCASMQPSSVCDTDQPSRICEKIPQPEHADIALQLVNVRLLKNDTYTAKQAIDFLDKCEKYIDGAATYADVARWIASRMDQVGIEVLILSNYLSVIEIEAPIYEYDRMLLKKHIQRQKDMIRMYMGK